MQTFPFAFAPQWRRPLSLAGINPRTATVTISDDSLLVHFGPWRVQTALSNILDTTITEDYKWFRAIGPHLSLTDRGLTFGSNTDRGLCICFHEPVAGLEPTGRIKHPGLTVTVRDPEALAAALKTV